MASDKQDDDLARMPTWKSYLYNLQQQAPKPKRIICQKEVTGRPPYYAKEYHGAISREEADFLLTIGGEGSYLIRESQRAPGQYTLAIRFDGATKNFKLYYDGQHYVGEKRFDNVQDLVADGLITYYLESKAADYIASLSSRSNYADSPYFAFNTMKKRQMQSVPKDSPAPPGGGGIAQPVNASGVSNFSNAVSSNNAANTAVNAMAPSGDAVDGKSNGVAHQRVTKASFPVDGRISSFLDNRRSESSPVTEPQSASSAQINSSQLASQSSSIAPPSQHTSSQLSSPLLHADQRRSPAESRLNRGISSAENSNISPMSTSSSSSPVSTLNSSDSIPTIVARSRTNKKIPKAAPPPPMEDQSSTSLVSDAAKQQENMKLSSVIWCTNYLEIMGCEKQHNFKLYTFMGPHWCDYCANFLWGLIAQGVKCQDCGFNAHKKCSEKVPNDCMPDMKHIRRVFGVDLTTLVKAQNKLIPGVVEMCVEEIERRGLEVEGLYRVAGYHDDIEAIKMAFDNDDAVDLSPYRCEDINTICGVLKLYFRLLPIPLVTFDVYFKVIDTVRRDDMAADVKLDVLKRHLQQLPRAHLHTLHYLMKHLSKVADKKQQNMMNVDNLAMVFAPTLLRSPETDPISSLTAIKFERELIEAMIINHRRLFE